VNTSRPLLRRRSGVALITVAVAACAAAVGLLSPVATSAVGGGSITLRIPSDWPNFDVQQSVIVTNAQLVMPAYDRLVARGPGLKIVPYLATSWKVTTTSATFQLRKDAKCADGSSITPKAVRDSFQRLIEVPKTSNALPNYFGVGPYSVSADDKKWTFTFRVGTPFRNLLNGFALGGSVVVCPAGIKAVASDPHALETQMYGSGPYTLVSATHGDQVVYHKRTNWTWGPRGSTPIAQLPDTLIYRIVGNETTAANLLLTGGVDVTGTGALGPDVDRLIANKSLIHHAGQNYHVYPMTFNQFPGRITNDDVLRQALMTAIDPKEWNQAAFAGHGVTSDSLLAPGSECWTKDSYKYMPTPSLDKARQILQQGGYTVSGGKLMKGGDQVHIRLATSVAMGSGGEYLANQFRQLGVDVDLANSEPATYSRDLIQGNYDVGVSSYTVTTPDPGQDLAFYSGATLPKGFNISNTGAGDPLYHRLARLALGTLGKTSCGYFHQLERRYLEKHYLLPLSAPTFDMFSNGKWDFLPISGYFEVAYLKPLK
jgi:peptide/nickel transport system substrate-binding protein